MKTFRIGTRGSQLAWTQSGHAKALLEAAHSGVNFELVRISTRGDRDQSTPLVSMLGTGLFTKELEESLLSGEIDMAIHSLKDVPYQTAPGCALGAFLERESPFDALLTAVGGLDDLPLGARIGTSSPRRIAQLKAFRSDLVFGDLRGNLDTRIRRLDEKEFDAIVLAEAGLRRLGLQARVCQALSPEVCVPAFGQGVLVVECRSEDAEVLQVLKAVDAVAVRRGAEIERQLMLLLGGGCKAALAALCSPGTLGWDVLASIGDPRSGRVIRKGWSGNNADADAAMQGLAGEMLQQARDAGIVWQ